MTSDSKKSILFLCKCMKDFFRFLEDIGVTLPIKASYSHLKSYEETLLQQGIDRQKISDRLAIIEKFYKQGLNNPL